MCGEVGSGGSSSSLLPATRSAVFKLPRMSGLSAAVSIKRQKALLQTSTIQLKECKMEIGGAN